MQVRQNEIMFEYLKEIKYDFDIQKVVLSVDLEKIVNSEFKEENDCILLSGVNMNILKPVLDSDFEKCLFEYNETHFHPDSYSIKSAGELNYLVLALDSGKRLIQRFKNEYGKRRFKIIISFSETKRDSDNRIESYGSSTVRFHQIRSRCDTVIGDLNSFNSEAIMEIEI